MNKTLYLYTNSFPYGNQEAFIGDELPYLSKNFEKINIIPLFGGEVLRDTHFSNIKIYSPIFKNNKINIFFVKYLFNRKFWKLLFRGKDFLKHKGLISLIKRIIIIFVASERVKKIANKHPDSIFYFYWGIHAAESVLITRIKNYKFVRFHGYDLYNSEIRDNGEALFLNEILPNFNYIAPISKFGKNILDSLTNKKVVTNYLGVDSFGLNPLNQSKKLKIITCSNLYPVKRLQLLAQALSKITEIEIRWTHLGGGEEDILNQIRRSLVLNKNIVFDYRGYVTREEVRDIYSNEAFDVFLNTSSSEGIPVSIMEALSFGIPVLATDAGGNSEIINESCGKILRLDISAEELSQELITFYNKSFLNKELRESAYKRWHETFNAQKNYQKFFSDIKEDYERFKS